MKTFIYLIIILDFTQSVLCKQFSNETGEDLLPVCPNVRRKREYTRWRAQTDKPTEFVVKVFDDYDDVIPPPTKVVPMLPVPQRRTPPKIIVSGITVRVPAREPESTLVDWAVEYTRFKPPAGKPVQALLTNGAEGKTIIPIADKSILNVQNDYGVVKPPKRADTGLHPQRDESPPARPLFVARTPADPRIPSYQPQEVPFAKPASRLQPVAQYAPLAPGAAILTEQSPTNRYVIFSKYLEPSTSIQVPLSYDGTPPTRTTEDLYDQRQLDLDDITSNDIVITRSTPRLKEDLARTTKNYLKSMLGGMVGRYFSRTVAPALMKVVPTVTKSTSKKQTTDIFIEVYPNYDIGRKKGDELGLAMTIPSTSKSSSGLEIRKAETLTTKEPQTASMKTIKGIKEVPLKEAAREFERSQIDGDFEYDEEKDGSINSVTLKSAEEEISLNVTSPELSPKTRNRVCSLEEVNQFNFTYIATLNEIYDKLKAWASRSPVTEIIDITQGNLTTMENPIYMLTVEDPSGGQLSSAKQTVMIVAGIQGRDHYAVAAAMYVLYQFIERSEVHSDLLNKYRFWIIPVFNPDGYEYSRSFANRREWKKNLRQNWETCKDPGSSPETCKPCEEYGIRCYLQPCYGINLDRNFEYQWIPGHELRAEHRCGDLYAGKRQLSEVETFSLTNYLHELRMPIFAFIAYKEGDVLGIMYPYSHTRKLRTFDNVYRNRATNAAASAFSINGRPYVAGQTSEFLALYAGGIEDWIDGHLGIDNSYAIIMNRPGDTKFAVSIESVAHEAYAAMDTLLLQKSTVDPTSAKPQRAPFASGRRRGSKAANSRTNLRVLFIILFINWFR